MSWIKAQDRLPSKLTWYKVKFTNGELLKIPFVRNITGTKEWLTPSFKPLKDLEVDSWEEILKQVKQKHMIVVDGACSPNPGIGSYQAFDISEGIEKKKFMFRYDISGTTTNNVAEYLAIVHAIGYALKNGMQDKEIWSDSTTAIAWVRKREDNCNRSIIEAKSCELLDRANKFIRELPLSDFDTEKQIKFWNKKVLGVENPADFGNKKY